MRVALYARVSTEEQSNDAQLGSLREFAKNRGFEVVGEYADVTSGSKSSRPQLDLLMKDLFNKEFEALVVWKLDRLGRSLQHLVTIVNHMKSYNVELIVVTQQIDTTTSGGRLVFNIFASIAEFERELISERTKQGLKYAKNVGKRGKDKKPRKKGGYYLRHSPHLRLQG